MKFIWLINKLKASSDNPVELAIERLVLAEISGCEYCASVHRLTGMVPVICESEDVIRCYTWLKDIEERAEMEVMARKQEVGP